MSGEYADELVADLTLMVAQALPSWGIAAAETAIRLVSLSENATFLIGDPGSDFILRVHRVGYSSPAEIRSELAWIEALRADRVVETARLIPGRDGELVQTLISPSGRPSRYAVAFERLPGQEPEPGGEAAAQWFERLGEVTARMHAHAKGWRLPTGFERKRWDLDGMVGRRAYWGPWRGAIGLNAEGAQVLGRALALIVERLAAFGSGPERFGLVHADLRLANLLVDERNLRIIDFDDCGFSWFLYDFATAVSFIEGDPKVPALLEAWVTGYRKHAPLGELEVAELPTFVMLRRILLCAWLASHSEVPLAREQGAAFTAATVEIAQAFLQGRYLARSAARNES